MNSIIHFELHNPMKRNVAESMRIRCHSNSNIPEASQHCRCVGRKILFLPKKKKYRKKTRIMVSYYVWFVCRFFAFQKFRIPSIQFSSEHCAQTLRPFAINGIKQYLAKTIYMEKHIQFSYLSIFLYFTLPFRLRLSTPHWNKIKNFFSNS